MNLNDIPKPNHEHGNLPAGFFDNQANQIMRKTVELENWKYAENKEVHSFFPIPDGYWLQMENGIREKFQKTDTFQWAKGWNPTLQWITACFGIILIGLGSFLFWPSSQKLNSENWSAQLEQIPESELLAYVANAQGEVKETTDFLAVQYVELSDIPSPVSSFDEQEIEKSVDELSTFDIRQYIVVD